MKSFAVFLVVIAGTMWAGSGLAAQHFLAHNDHTAMDLTVFRMISTALIIVRRKGMSKPPVKLGVDKSYLIEKERTS